MAFTKRASSGKGKLIHPHILQTQQQQRNKNTDNGQPQTILKVTLHFGRRQTQMDPLRPICPKPKWFSPQGCFCSVFSQLLSWQQNLRSSCAAQTSYSSPVALALCWPPPHRTDASVPCSWHQPLRHPQVLSYTPSWEKPLGPFLQAGGSNKSEGFKSMKPRSIHVSHPNSNS